MYLNDVIQQDRLKATVLMSGDVPEPLDSLPWDLRVAIIEGLREVRDRLPMMTSRKSLSKGPFHEPI